LLLHNPRKFHPSFDPVVVALLLRAERQGLRLLVPEKALRLLLPRWATRLRQACEEAAAGAGLFPRGRLDETEADEADEHTCADILSSEPGAVLARVQQHVVTVPPLDHAKYLQLLALGSLFLNTFPFGAGVTSGEAISACVPVLASVGDTAVLNIAAAQLSKLGPALSSRLLVVHGGAAALATRALDIMGLGTSPEAAHWQLRTEICRAKDALFSVQAREEVAVEYARVLGTLAGLRVLAA
jgi:hypothetical protein